ncbi:MAG: SulP family inorganic anion transporter [Betaproteobacteria bacterium]|nr:SulP family inorganic anion transporter [Betaproteobacteria bacterium]
MAPGLATLMNYRSGDLPHDIRAGVSVAAVALPVGVAYAQLAGFNPAVGLYASILPLVAYALFGTSRQLVVGPDAATCALVAAAVAPLAMGNDQLYLSLSMALAFLAGLFCIGASFLRLGALADFLSRPILVGFLNGISIHILLGQIGKIVGFNIDAVGIVPTAIELARSIGSTHWPTLLVGLSAFAIMAIAPRWLPKIPAALVAIVFAGIAVALFGLDAYGVKVVGKVPAGLPALHLPSFPPELLKDIVGAAAGIALVSFSSMMLTARSFASKNGYDIDADREFCALGVANMASAVSQGFAISGADSRTAMADASGGRTQVTGLVAAATVTLVLMFLTEHLAYVPVAALGAVLMQASFGLMNLPALREFWRLDRHEFGLSIIVTLGVVWVGAIQAIVLAVVLAVLRFVQIAARPLAEVLGEVPGHPGFHSLTRHPDAQVPPGLVLFRFNGPLVFFNAPYFKRSVFEALDRAGPGVKWFVIDMLPMPYTDITGMQTARELLAELKTRGIELVTAGRVGEMLELSQLKGISEAERLPIRRFSTLRKALQAFKAKQNQAATSPE